MLQTKLERKDVSFYILFILCRWELQEVMYGKASFTARRRIHGVVANYYLSGRDLIFTGAVAKTNIQLNERVVDRSPLLQNCHFLNRN